MEGDLTTDGLNFRSDHDSQVIIITRSGDPGHRKCAVAMLKVQNPVFMREQLCFPSVRIRCALASVISITAAPV